MIPFEEYHADLEAKRKAALDATMIVEPMTAESEERIAAFRAINEKAFARGERDRRHADRRIWNLQRKIELADAERLKAQKGGTV